MTAVEASAALQRSGSSGRTRLITLVLAGIALVLVTVSLSVGAYTLPIPDLVQTLIGQGTGSDNFIIFRLRMPRLLIGVLVGCAFGIAGALFQTLLRNPLASPDIIGVSQGASVAAAFSILTLGFSGAAVSLAAFLGAIVVATGIYLLAWRGGVTGFRFVLIGVGVAFMVQAVLGYLITRGDVREVQQALVWMVGGLGSASWVDIAVIVAALVVLFPLVWVLSARLRILQLGDDAAGGLGLRPERSRLAILFVAVALVAVATAFVGPLAFVAFVAAPIARRMLGTGGLALVQSALVGAVLVVAADFVAQHLLPGDVQVPAGIVTGLVGAPYLLWLLATTNRGGRGA
ncbi:FecCD family ABC transporter permease [Homoserinimonas sp. A447]